MNIKPCHSQGNSVPRPQEIAPWTIDLGTSSVSSMLCSRRTYDQESDKGSLERGQWSPMGLMEDQKGECFMQGCSQGF